MSLILTRTQPLRTQYAAEFDKNERRRSVYGAYDTFVRDTASPQSILSQEAKDFAKMSFGNTVQIPVIDAKEVTISNVRKCDWQSDENVSKLVTLNFATVSFGFTMQPAQHANNAISYQRDFDVKLQNYLLKLAAKLDELAVDSLETNKNTVWTPDTLALYPQVGDALQVSADQSDDLYNQMSAIMQTMDFYGDINVVGSTMHQALVRRYQNQGASNSTNLAYQFGGYDWAFTNRIVNGQDANGKAIPSTAYFAQPGTLGFINRNDPDSIMGNKAGDGTEWSEVLMPIVNLNMGSMYKSKCSDVDNIVGGTSGLTASMLEMYAFSTDICYITAYNSDPTKRNNPIVKTQILAKD